VLYGGFQWVVDPEKGAKTGPKLIINTILASAYSWYIHSID
jgi:hypothetical protein